jgi:outer membrane usher protein
VPYYRSGVLAEFPIRRSRGATFTVRLDDGSLLPSGATITIDGRDESFPVGLAGQAYATGLERANRVTARWRGRDCTFDVPFPPTKDPLPDLGTFACHGVAP